MKSMASSRPTTVRSFSHCCPHCVVKSSSLPSERMNRPFHVTCRSRRGGAGSGVHPKTNAVENSWIQSRRKSLGLSHRGSSKGRSAGRLSDQVGCKVHVCEDVVLQVP